MSLINGPKKIKTSVDAGLNLSSMVPVSLAIAGMRALEKAIGVRFDPAPAYLFYVEITGVIVALFTECSGIEVTRSVENVVEGGVNDHVHNLPGSVQYGRITLSRGISMSRELWNWFDEGRYDFKVKKVNLSIIQGAPGHNLIGGALGVGSGYGVIKRWDVENAFPTSWRLSKLDVNNIQTAAIESVEFVFDNISPSKIVGTPMFMVGSI